MKKLLFCLSMLVFSVCAMAQIGETRPFNFSITPDIAIYSRHTTIEGVTLSVWGENPQKSLALGIVNGTVGQSAGLSASFILNYNDSYKGVQWSIVNYSKRDSMGWDAGLIDFTENAMTGLATGLVNYAGRLRGLQFGLINFVEDTDTGVQIGLINIIQTNNDWFSDLPNSLAPVMLFVNWRK